jgi:effector-binding domain-containing protein
MLFKIGDFSRFCRITVRTLRYYDEIGLFKPVHIDQNSGYRYYSVEQMPRLNHIIMFKELGLSLDDIKDLLLNGIPVKHIRQLLQVKKAEIQERLNQDSKKLGHVEEWLDTIDKDGLTPIVTGIQIKVVPEFKVISRREKGTYEETLLKLSEELKSVLNRRENQMSVTITGPVLMLCYDDEYKEKDADIEIAIPISGEISSGGSSYEVRVLPEVRVISAIHNGPYQNIGKVYTQIFKYADEHELKIITPVRETYFNIQGAVAENELLTEIGCPFKKDDSG